MEPRIGWLGSSLPRGTRSTPGRIRHPATRLAELQSAHQPDVWMYRFDWLSPAFGGSLGACHALEVPFVFGTHDREPLRSMVGPGADGLAARMRGAWLAFARGGEPAHAELPSWPRYDTERRATLLLGPICEVVEAPDERERAFWDEIA